MRGRTTDLSRVEVFGASVAGPRHRHLGERNQDAWVPLRGRTLRGAVVADGLGSAPAGRLGARLACRAARLALRIWAKTRAPLDTVGPLIDATWATLLGDIPPPAARSTCLFGVVLPDGSAVAGQLGDGLVAVVTDGALAPAPSTRSAFGNETHALGTGADWRIEQVPFSETSILLLATDGVYDDLAPGTTAPFAHHVIDTYGPLPPSHRWRRLAADLRAWPVPHHLDDKTIAALYVPS